MRVKINKYFAVFLYIIIILPALAKAELSTNITELFSIDKDGALAMNMTDPLKGFKKKFSIPTDLEGNPIIYLNSNVLGLAPLKAKEYLLEEINAWEKLGISARNKEQNPWNKYHESFKISFSKLLGASPQEIVLMNSLSTNLHLAMVSFYRPSKTRYKIMIEAPVYRSDLYVIQSQLKFHKIDIDDALIIVEKQSGVKELTMEDFREQFEANKDSVALVITSSVNHLTGQLLDVKNLTKLAHSNGAIIGLNLAHSIGNVPLKLHEWDIDFAMWC